MAKVIPFICKIAFALLRGDAQVLIDELVDNLADDIFGRKLHTSSVHQLDLGNVTFGKPGCPATASQTALRPHVPQLAHLHSTFCHSVSSWSRRQPHIRGGLAPRRLERMSCSSLPLPKLLGGISAASAILLSKSFKLVHQGDVAIMERFGKFLRQLGPGLHLKIPLVDDIRSTITTREQVLDIPPQKCITSDNAPLTADAVVYWQIFDAEKAVYAVVDLTSAIQNLVLTQLRAEIGKLTLDMTFSARERINAAILQDLDVATDPWGVKITRVEVRDIIPNREILQAMEMQMAAERTKRAAIIKSEGERERAINEAEGVAQSRLIDANASAEAVKIKAEAEATKLEVEAMGSSRALATLAQSLGGTEDAARFQLMLAHIAAQRFLAASSNTKVIVTSNDADDVFAKAIGFYDASRNVPPPETKFDE